MHASRVLAIVEDIVDNTGNPDKIRKLMQDLGRNHYKQVCTLTVNDTIFVRSFKPNHIPFEINLWLISF